MRTVHKISTVLLLLLLAAAGIAWWRTAPPSAKVRKDSAAALAATQVVDQSTYTIARRLADLADTPEEQAFAQSALRVADHSLAFSFTSALREAEAHPPTLSPEALQIQDRIRKSEAMIDADEHRVTQWEDELAHANEEHKDALRDELNLAKSQLELDKNELDEANQDFVEAGGNPQRQIEALQQEHDAEVKARSVRTLAAPAAPETHGAFTRFIDWLHLRRKQQEIDDARDHSTQKVQRLTARHDALSVSLENTKRSIAEISKHAGGDNAQGATAGAQAPRFHENAATLIDQTKQIAADQQVQTLLDRRIADQNQLAQIYGQWSTLLTAQSHIQVHALLFDAAIVILILLALLLIDERLEKLLDNPKLDRRQIATLRSITRLALRVVAVIVVLLILIGVPTQFGTMIGIVGAGVTVAMKDFILAFFGWLILMGRNGMRVGDWVEINGVSGEVIELGMFRTVLLETGNWSDTGRPTGRRVTFTNSFAIEKHYFNFSTTGQWLWDELQVVVPTGRDPYPIVDSITKAVKEATAENARLAEEEWHRSASGQRGRSFSGAPGVNVKPVVGGVEIAVRYITRAHERFVLRGKLYQDAVDLLGEKYAVHATQ
jgi:small-conductance mechanosensitive channel